MCKFLFILIFFTFLGLNVDGAKLIAADLQRIRRNWEVADARIVARRYSFGINGKRSPKTQW